tara:strand:- start:21603 stop:22196 length:594 start_codon:yes stop_codon:yes gene_type:complete
MNNFRIDNLQYCNWSRQIFDINQEAKLDAIHVTIAYHEDFEEVKKNISDWERHPKKIFKIKRDNRHDELCPIYCGVAFLDQIQEIELLRKITFYNLSYPILILAFISKASEVLGKKILVQFANSSFLMNFNKSILVKNLDSQVISSASEISIEILDNEDSFCNYEWQELYKLSEKTFVEESDILKEKGAGAGLLDND